MEKNPLVSIIIPTYNRMLTLSVTTSSVENQTYQNWECIIVDDGSTDSTKVQLLALWERDPRFIYTTNQHFKGAQGARNTGMEVAKGDYYIFLDSDDLLSADCLTRRMEAVRQFPGYDFYCFPTAVFKDLPDDSQHVWNYLHKEQKDLARFFNQDMPWHTCGVFWNRQIFQELKGWDEALTSWQDWNLHVRALMLKGVKYFKASDERENIDSFYRRDLARESIANTYNSEGYLKNTLFLIDQLSIPPHIYKQQDIKLAYARLCFRVGMEATQFFDFRAVKKFFRDNLRKVKYSGLYIFLWTGYLQNLIYPDSNRGLRRFYNQYPRFFMQKHLLKNESTHLRADYAEETRLKIILK